MKARKLSANTGLLLLAFLAYGGAAKAVDPYQECTSAISSNFNGTAIAGGNFVWFNAVLNVKGLNTSPVTVYVTRATVTFTANGTQYKVSVPNAVITLDSSTILATTEFTALSPPFLKNGWKTQLQFSGLAGNDLLAGVRILVPSGGLPGGIKNVTWQATFSSFTAGLTVNWQWGAAVYSEFNSDYNALAVKPVDDNQASQYKDSDHAGTPENFKAFVLGGGTGGGGSNFTGSYSGTGSCALTPDKTFSVTTSGTL